MKKNYDAFLLTLLFGLSAHSPNIHDRIRETSPKIAEISPTKVTLMLAFTVTDSFVRLR
jgi:hypothetical protein